jgi:hypothetical protein
MTYLERGSEILVIKLLNTVEDQRARVDGVNALLTLISS